MRQYGGYFLPSIASFGAVTGLLLLPFPWIIQLVAAVSVFSAGCYMGYRLVRAKVSRSVWVQANFYAFLSACVQFFLSHEFLLKSQWSLMPHWVYRIEAAAVLIAIVVLQAAINAFIAYPPSIVMFVLFGALLIASLLPGSLAGRTLRYLRLGGGLPINIEFKAASEKPFAA